MNAWKQRAEVCEPGSIESYLWSQGTSDGFAVRLRISSVSLMVATLLSKKLCGWPGALDASRVLFRKLQIDFDKREVEEYGSVSASKVTPLHKSSYRGTTAKPRE